MPRPIRNNTARNSRNNGLMSGATIQIIKEGSVVGYATAHAEAGIKVVTGIVDTASGKASNQTFSGITTIKQVLLTPCAVTSGSSAYVCCVDYNAAPNYTSGATVAHFKVYTYNGALASSAVSVAYTAIGI
jgi:hypothetical protein